MNEKSFLISKKDLKQENRSDVLAAILAFFGGSLGLHRLYLGHYISGGLIILIQLLTKFKFLPVFLILGIVDGAIILLLSKEIREEKSKKRQERRDEARRELPKKENPSLEKKEKDEDKDKELVIEKETPPSKEEDLEVTFSYDQYDELIKLMDVDRKFLGLDYFKENLIDLFSSNLLIVKEGLDLSQDKNLPGLKDYFETARLDEATIGLLGRIWNLSDNSLRHFIGNMPFLRVESDWDKLGQDLDDLSLDRMRINMEEFNFEKPRLKDLYQILDIWPSIWETIADRMVEMNYKQTIDHLEEVKDHKEYVNIVRKIYNTCESDQLRKYTYGELKRLNLSLTPTEKRIYEQIK